MNKRHTEKLLAAGLITALLTLTSCTITPKQAAQLETLHKIYGSAVQVEGSK